MSRIVGYARVSSKEQNLDRQLSALRQYVSEDMIVIDKASGKDLNRAGYQSLKVGLGKLVKGDVLYIKSIDRLSRDKEHIKKELQYFAEIGVKVKIIDLPTTLKDYSDDERWIYDMANNILIDVLASIAQAEREAINKRRIEGVEAMPIDEKTGKRISKRTGNVVGRPKAEYPVNWAKVYKQWQNKEITARKAMELLKLKNNTFYKLAKEYSKNN